VRIAASFSHRLNGAGEADVVARIAIILREQLGPAESKRNSRDLGQSFIPI
jgi:hypothetical protein